MGLWFLHLWRRLVLTAEIGFSVDLRPTIPCSPRPPGRFIDHLVRSRLAPGLPISVTTFLVRVL